MTEQPSSAHLFNIYDKASIPRADCIYDFSYDEMMHLGELFTGWAMDKRSTPEQTAEFLGFGESYRSLAEHMGRDWKPEPPKRRSLLQYIAHGCAEPDFAEMDHRRLT